MKELLSVRRFSLLFLLIFSSLGMMLLSSGCANIIPPQGGPRDTLPPRLVKATPADSTTNFHSRRIELTFDEFINLENVQQNVMVSPTFATSPPIDVRLRTMTIRFPAEDTLEPNTTYTFNFGNSLKDINEGNVLPGFSYTFSTGPAFDTLSLSGNVLLAESGKIDTTLIAVLYRNPSDSAIVKERPRYIARLNGTGNFTFHNLPSGTFYVYVFNGPGSQSRYNARQYFAFADSPVLIRPNTPPVTLYAYKTDAGPKTPATQAETTTDNRRNNNNGNGSDRRLRFSTNLSNDQQDLLKNFILTFEKPLRLYDSSRLRLTQDSTFSAVTYRTALDSTRTQLTLQTQWTPATTYSLILDRDFAEDSLGRRLLKSDTLTFTTRKLTDYGRLRIRLKDADSTQHPIIQLLQNGAVVYSTSISSGEMVINQFTPGDYDAQILLDRNNNGKWDPGQFFGTRRQPEMVKPLTQRITVKGGANNDIEVSLK